MGVKRVGGCCGRRGAQLHCVRASNVAIRNQLRLFPVFCLILLCSATAPPRISTWRLRTLTELRTHTHTHTYICLHTHPNAHWCAPHRRIHTSAISNTWWMRYFIVTALQASLHLARIIYGMPGSVCDVVLFYLQVRGLLFCAVQICAIRLQMCKRPAGSLLPPDDHYCCHVKKDERGSLICGALVGTVSVFLGTALQRPLYAHFA